MSRFRPRSAGPLSQRPPDGSGEVAEWSKAPHSKCGVPGRVPWVRIPPSPPTLSLHSERESIQPSSGIVCAPSRSVLATSICRRPGMDARHRRVPGRRSTVQGFAFNYGDTPLNSPLPPPSVPAFPLPARAHSQPPTVLRGPQHPAVTPRSQFDAGAWWRRLGRREAGVN